MSPDHALEERIRQFDVAALRDEYFANGEFLFIESFLPQPLVDGCDEEAEQLAPHVHRSYVPNVKKGGSVGFDGIDRFAPSIAETYRSPALRRFIQAIVDTPIELCPERDLHRCALYSYTQPGDHIGFHYDRSYYRGRRYTALLGLRDRSSSRLVYRLHTRERGHPIDEHAVATPPGCLVLFDGNKLYHRVSPLGVGEERLVISLEYVTDPRMNALRRLISDMKDAFVYFGFSKVFGARRGRRDRTPAETPLP